MTNEIIISTDNVDLRQMVIKLMGRGMTVSQDIEGQFVVTLDDVVDLINRISQRVQLQNHCKMSDFFAEFQFRDGSKEKIPSLEAFQIYRSVNSSACTSCHLSFAFLINFSRGVEKQSIDISLKSPAKEGFLLKISSILNEDENYFGKMSINIEYTDVTWANDIKNLFEKYCDTHLEKYETRIKLINLISVRNLVIFSFPLIATVSAISAGGYDKSLRIKEAVSNYFKNSDLRPSDELISRKLDFLIYKMNDTTSVRDLVAAIIVFICIFAFMVLGIKLLRSIPLSAILISPETKKIHDRQEARRSRTNAYAVGGIFLSLLIGIASSNLDRLIIKFF
jgi:hypothetical protein